MYNARLAEIFEEIANMLELDEEKDRHFEVLAYRKAALTIGTMQEDVGEIYRKQGVKGLLEIPGVGKSIAGHIKEYVDTGKIAKYEELKKKFPIDFSKLTKIQGLGAKKIFKLYKALKVKNADDLKKAIAEHKIRDLEGFGERSEQELEKNLGIAAAGGGRLLLGVGLPEAESMVKALKESGLADRVAIAGSTRRMRETVGDLDILVTSKKPEEMMDFVTKLGNVEGVVLKGPTKTTVRLRIGLTCDVRVVKPESFGAALQYFTGNKDHNVKLRTIAIKQGYKLNEYGMFNRKGKNAVGLDECDVYKVLGMDCMEPEMREDRGEIELALKHSLPKLVQLSDIKSDLHVHSNHSDGDSTIAEMAAEASKLGYKYVGMTDHTKAETQARGMDDAKFRKYDNEIDKFNDSQKKIRVLKSAEIDILKDGSLDLKDETLELLDYRIASVHRNLNMSTEEMTKRVIAAFETGYVDVFAHPTDRLINERSGISLDIEKVFDAASRNKVAMEIDSYPNRLDLSDEHIFIARRYKLKFTIDTDAHKPQDFGFMRYGIGMAKRGWLTKNDVLNTLNCDKFLAAIRK